jgi:hypothetical protein
MINEVARRLVANHRAAAVRGTNSMPSHATARSCARRHDDGAWNDHDGSAAVRAAATIGSAMKAGTAATRHLDNHAVRSLDRRKRHRLRAASR